MRIIALRAPMADDLREVVAALKIAGVIERIGDYAKNIAKRVPLIDERAAIEPLSLLPAMARIAARNGARRARRASPRAMPTPAVRVCIERDRAVDDFYNRIFRMLRHLHDGESRRPSASVAHLLFVAKNLERIGDHATNVAEMVYFAATGDHMADRAKREPS